MNRVPLHGIFDVVDFPTLRVASHVSRLWRSSARSHPAFWKRLSIDDSTPLMPGAVQLFLDRLNSKRSTDIHATIFLYLRCTIPSSAMICYILPAIRKHLHRAEELALIVSRALVCDVWPLFTLDAPRLRNLQVMMDCPGPHPDPLPGIFNAHRYTSLERVFLMEVPLSIGIEPLTHVLKGLKAVYSDDCSHLARVASCLPRSQSLDLWLCRGRRSNLDFRSFPTIDSAQLEVLRHLVVHHIEPFPGPSNWRIPIVTVSIGQFLPGQARQFLPETGPLAICFRRMDRPLCSAAHVAGSVTVTTLDGEIVRHFSPVAALQMISITFLGDIILADRLFMLSSPLFSAFYTLCVHSYHLPRLTIIRIALDTVGDQFPCWKVGMLHCPRLKTLVLQRQSDHQEAIVSLAAVQSFVKTVISGHDEASLSVVLEGIRLKADETLPRVLAVTERASYPRLGHTVECDDDDMSINKLPALFGEPRSDWL